VTAALADDGLRNRVRTLAGQPSTTTGPAQAADLLESFGSVRYTN
jgi:hypothetical protein